MRILFVADIHGADLILRKSLRAVAEYGISVLILAGDLSGKSLHPMVERADGTFGAQGRSGVVESLSAAAAGELERELADQGQYSFRCTQAEFQELKQNPAAVNRIFTGRIIDRLEGWRDLIASRLDLRAVQTFITPGNDDPPDLDEILQSFEPRGIFSNLQAPHDFGANEMITLDFTNPTPWNTPREMSERDLSWKIEEKVRRLARPERAIFNFHCPPFRTKLDLAPKLDRNLRPVSSPGAETEVHVGSTAVRRAIEELQPLLSLHGHIHESAGEDSLGRTTCLNPGSEYWTGILHAYVVEIDADGDLRSYVRVEG
jgi:Icc-related predicted phosphoesterase